MNKSAVALGVAAALATSAIASVTASTDAYAETTLYGSARGSLIWNNPKSNVRFLRDEDGEVIREPITGIPIRGPSQNNKSFWKIRNHSSRIGVIGSEDLGNGLSVIYQYEFGVDLTDGRNLESNRPKLVGLKGGFGQASLGTQWTPYYNVAGRVDVFNASYYNQAKDIFRRNNSLYYATPDLSGFKAEALGVFDGQTFGGPEGDTIGKRGLDEWSANATYSNGPFGAGVAYIKNEFNKGDSWVISAGYSFGNFSVGGMYEDGDYQSFGSSRALVDFVDKTKWYGLVGTYSFGNNIVRAAWGALDPKKISNGKLATVAEFRPDLLRDCELDSRCRKALRGDRLNEWALGLQHNLSKRSRLWVEWQQVEKDFDQVSIGMRHDF